MNRTLLVLAAIGLAFASYLSVGAPAMWAYLALCLWAVSGLV